MRNRFTNDEIAQIINLVMLNEHIAKEAILDRIRELESSASSSDALRKKFNNIIRETLVKPGYYQIENDILHQTLKFQTLIKEIPLDLLLEMTSNRKSFSNTLSSHQGIKPSIGFVTVNSLETPLFMKTPREQLADFLQAIESAFISEGYL